MHLAAPPTSNEIAPQNYGQHFQDRVSADRDDAAADIHRPRVRWPATECFWRWAFAVIMNFVSYFYSDKIALAMYRAQPVTREATSARLRGG